MNYRQGQPDFNTGGKNVVNFKDFIQNTNQEETELEKIKRGFRKNELSIGPSEQKMVFNRLTRKWDTLSKDMIKDKLAALKENVGSGGIYKATEEIEGEFEDFILLEHERIDNLKHLYPNNVAQIYLTWEFPDGDSHVGGGSSTTVEDVAVNLVTGDFYYSVNNWYPKKTYERMRSIIETLLSDEYGVDTPNLIKSTDFHDKYRNS